MARYGHPTPTLTIGRTLTRFTTEAGVTDCRLISHERCLDRLWFKLSHPAMPDIPNRCSFSLFINSLLFSKEVCDERCCYPMAAAEFRGPVGNYRLALQPDARRLGGDQGYPR